MTSGRPPATPGPLPGIPTPAFVPYGPPPRPEGGFRRGLGIGAGVGLGFGGAVMLGSIISSLVLALAVAGLAGSVAGLNTATAQPLRTIWGQASATSTLRAIEITGTILTDTDDGVTLSAGTYGYEVADLIDELDAKEASGLVLILNTPGGTITGARAIADAVSRYQQRTGHKVVAHVQGMSASGGMYAMAGADEILADHGSIVGSIGVILGPIERYKDVTAITGTLLTPGVVTTGGITQEYLTQGTGKDAGTPFRDLTPAERAAFTNLIVNEYDTFVTRVSQARDIPADTIRNELGAFLFDTRTAKEKGLIDEVMGTDEAYARAAQLNGLDPTKTKVVAATVPTPLEVLLGVEARVFGQAPAAQPVGGQPARATSRICTGTPSVLVYHGSVAAACG